MARNLLTDRAVKTARADKETLLADGDGLFLRIRPADKPPAGKDWIFRYTHLGPPRKKMGLGSYPDISLLVARERATAARQLVSDGIDPKEARARALEAAKAQAALERAGTVPRTVRALFDAWRTNYLITNHSDQGLMVERLFEKHVMPTLADLALDQLRSRHITTVLDLTRKAGLTRTCGVLLANLRQMCQFAVPREWLIGDPTAALKARSWSGESVECDRFLSEEEVTKLSLILDTADINERWKAGIRLLLATGTRVGETLLAEVRHFDLRARTWMIPAENQKKTNRNQALDDFVIYLSPRALILVQKLIELSPPPPPDSDGHPRTHWLFPARTGYGPANEKTLTHLIKDRQRDVPLKGRTKAVNDFRLPGGPWTPHDLRRTMSTWMGELGVLREVSDKCLNHTIPGKVTRTYHRATLRAAMKEAWLIWGVKLAKLLDDEDDI
jgi:integrase